MSASGWRRTIDGWEPTHSWSRSVSFDELPVHPALIASGELLFCLLALSAIPSKAIVSKAVVTPYADR